MDWTVNPPRPIATTQTEQPVLSRSADLWNAKLIQKRLYLRSALAERPEWYCHWRHVARAHDNIAAVATGENQPLCHGWQEQEPASLCSEKLVVFDKQNGCVRHL